MFRGPFRRPVVFSSIWCHVLQCSDKTEKAHRQGICTRVCRPEDAYSGLPHMILTCPLPLRQTLLATASLDTSHSHRTRRQKENPGRPGRTSGARCCYNVARENVHQRAQLKSKLASRGISYYFVASGEGGTAASLSTVLEQDHFCSDFLDSFATEPTIPKSTRMSVWLSHIGKGPPAQSRQGREVEDRL